MKDTLDFHGRPALGGFGSDGATTAGSFSDDLNLGLIHDDCVPLLRTCRRDGEGGRGGGVGGEEGMTGESQKGLVLQAQKRCTGQTVATPESSHLVKDGGYCGVASGRACQRPVSICERFKGYTFGDDMC